MSTGSDARADALVAKATAFRLTESAEAIALRACRKAGVPAAQASSVATAVRAGMIRTADKWLRDLGGSGGALSDLLTEP